jgi:hypothetical protein
MAIRARRNSLAAEGKAPDVIEEMNEGDADSNSVSLGCLRGLILTSLDNN